ncbi:hypothetical protein D0863_02065 [Hortaea werneckii]|uniref:Peptidase A1 domain-containing protein n=1 Tax=Hortaea werneckii TaxID=91943 RepID=A0A3M7EI39_HORWE|nr:hypothetical protein D0863_02065 [Hortaea werneckii]
MFELLLLLYSLVPEAQAACTGPSPLTLNITDVQLSNGGSKRGILGSLGTPAQNISLLPQNFLNNTWLIKCSGQVYNTSAPLCFENTTVTQCLTQRGGLYDPGASSSARGGLDVYEAGGDVDDTARRAATHVWYNEFAQDDITIGNTTLERYPIAMPGLDVGGRTDTQANIGLGRNSTLLSTLKQREKIPSRSYSYWWGIDSTSENVAMDGQLILGGYDAAKTTGPNITSNILPWSLACPSGMYITITSMDLGFPNGSRGDMLYPSSLVACLQLDWPFLASLRADPFYNNFEILTDTQYTNRSLGSYWFAPMYQSGNIFPGDVTVGLAEGLTFRVPNEVLVVGEQFVGSDGKMHTDNSAPLVLMSPTEAENSNDMPIIGMQFFSAAYLMVDLEAGTFTLWQANATTETNIFPIGGNCTEANKPSSSTSSSSAATPTTTKHADSDVASRTAEPSSISSPQASPQTLSTGTIAGIVVGGVLFLALLGGICLFIFRRKQQHRPAGNSSIALTDTKADPWGHDGSSNSQGWDYHQPPGYVEPMSEQINEMPTNQRQAFELGAVRKSAKWPYELASEPVEMPTARSPKVEKPA